MTVQSIAQALYDITAAMENRQDFKHSRQIQQLSSKLIDDRLTVALCGHFSAGKSTLINTLCGAKLLPSSPIPTSANVVQISGGSKAIAFVEQKQAGELVKNEVPIDELEQYCLDGEAIASISIQYPSELLGDHIMLLDTPGIDSTDDAHRMATESALHLADVVFYVMDYNHVQSEINFTFAKQLKDWGKPLYFIVNQVDKHREQEISFATYRKSVSDAFQMWHLEPAGILYLSLRYPDHPLNEYKKLVAIMEQLATQRQSLCAYSVVASLHHVVEQHNALIKLNNSDQYEKLLVAIGGEEAATTAQLQLAQLEEQKRELLEQPLRKMQQLREQVENILDNANITPASLREQIHSFLVSRQSGFKSGFLFAGAKTATEKAKRASNVLEELHKLIQASIQWHVKQLLRKEMIAVNDIAEQQVFFEQSLEQAISFLPNESWLESRVKQGAIMGNEYTMTYSHELAADIKRTYKQQSFQLIEQIGEYVQEQVNEQIASLQQQLETMGETMVRVNQLQQLQLAEQQMMEQTSKLLPDKLTAPSLPRLPESDLSRTDTIKEQLEQAIEHESSKGIDVSAVTKRHSDSDAAVQIRKATEAKGTLLHNQRLAAQRLQTAADFIRTEPTLVQATQTLREKADRLQQSNFTIALFGAFSAGKSSLANALIGEAVLPVSPNPTTASINRLLPPTEEYPHRSARIVMKSEEEMADDLRYSLALLGEDASEATLPTIATILSAAEKMSPDRIAANGRAHYSFLRAASIGFAEHEQWLGQELRVDHEQYERFVAEESRSCFVRSIDFHYLCPLTAEGIILVDTPGADSVNARHTGVAFDYIKNADAVLFVTYYNHAFSQADRQFLQQLGRVKDQFELDKMFFIVNAADLAADEQELSGVLTHVEQNLLQHEIRFPRLFPVSSLQALQAKVTNNQTILQQSGMAQFEAAFLQFVQHDLGTLALQTATLELQRVYAMVTSWLQATQGDQAKREQQLTDLLNNYEQLQSQFEGYRQKTVPQQLNEDISELHYYIAQRLQFRFGEFYNLSFNPAVLQDDGRDLRKALLQAWLELERVIQRELEQELQATSLRIENNLQRELTAYYDQLTAPIERVIDYYQAATVSFDSIRPPAMNRHFQAPVIEQKWLFQMFKSPRAFFEGEGKTKLRTDLEQLILPAVAEWLKIYTEDWQAFYRKMWTEQLAVTISKLELDIQEHVHGISSTLRDEQQKEKWEILHKKLQSLLDDHLVEK
ncbi:dynamin family protein [Paenibacillus yanchengensis]|uniref:Dynamin family protein n=1 Tax=Paenibacillus yanchengensis TaxID=2035833 RepID=A0ABW4YJN6_9BACL